MVHIAKTAGSSLRVDLFRRLHIAVNHTQFCFGELHRRPVCSGRLVTMLRSPREHVLSQYLECRFDGWGQNVTRGKHFPKSSSDFYLDFERWVHHFASRGLMGTTGPPNDFGCYNPINFMTRQLACSRPGAAEVGPNHHLPDPSNITLRVAMDNLRRVDAFGLTELYEASWCVLAHKLHGTLPGECKHDCQAERGAAKKAFTHVTHGVPPHSVSSVPAAVLREVDAITATDIDLYRIGVILFLAEVSQLEARYSTTIICPAELSRFFASIAYIGGFPVD